MATNPDTTRLASLDILRGFDLFLLVFLQPVFMALASWLDIPVLDTIAYQFTHETWEGFRLWDLVMPLFMFMAGAAIPFSFSKYLSTGTKAGLYRKIAVRVAILWVLGMVMQGNLLGFNPKHIYLYSNTLQAIAAGYAITSIIVLNLSLKWQVVATAALLIVYAIPMTFCGDWTHPGNFAEMVDQTILGRFRDLSTYNGDGTWTPNPYYDNTWIWSTLTFGATVMTGYFAGKIAKDGMGNRAKVAPTLAIIGVAMLIGAWLWSFQMPVIKRIWTSSMVLLSSGLCFLLFSLFYYIIDYKGYTKGLNWLKIYGTNSILAYFLGEKINFRSAVHSLSYGLEQYMGNGYDFLLTFGNYTIVFLILYLLYKHNIRLKI